MKKLSSVLFRRLGVVLLFVLLGFFVISTGSGKKVNYASNIGSATSLQAVHFVAKYDNLQEELEVKAVANMNEVATYGPDSPVSFVGQMTAYGADCKGCGGRVACPPRQDVRNNNIYYDDADYGTIRILAADRRIPCGSIIKIRNVTFSSEEMIGIVLDRGSAIVGNIIDLLVPAERDGYSVGRQRNVQYEIIRWGW